MSVDSENVAKWNEFVDIGNKIRTIRGTQAYKTRLAKYALLLSDELLENRFIVGLPAAERRTYTNLLQIIAEYLDGNAQMIESASKDYFLFLHGKAGLPENTFAIEFHDKTDGVQSGRICTLGIGAASVRYFIKTHQNGSKKSNLKSLDVPDLRELFIYKLLQYIGVGPETHFIIPLHGTKRTIYIATKECKLILLSNLKSESANKKALAQLDLISRILCLRDCATNPTNCGQLDGDKPIIIDFRILEQPHGYVKRDILQGFYSGNGEFNYKDRMAEAVSIDNEEKCAIMKQSLLQWNFLENMDKAAQYIAEISRKNADKIDFDDDLERYVSDVKETVRILNEA